MSHFLGEKVFQQNTSRIRMGVMVEFRRSGSLLVGEGKLVAVKTGTAVTKLPEEILVETREGELLKALSPSKFWVSIETIDPFHILIDAEVP